jgi:hypothetical protein
MRGAAFIKADLANRRRNGLKNVILAIPELCSADQA